MIERFHYMSNGNENKLWKGHCFKKRLKPIIIGFTCSRLIERQTQITVHERKNERHDRTNERTKKLYVCERAYNSMTTSDKSLYITSYQRCDISRKHFTNCSFDIKQHIHRISGLYHFVITFRRLLTFCAIVGIFFLPNASIHWDAVVCFVQQKQ